MPQQIQMGDQTYEFPDGMSDADMQAALDAEHERQNPSLFGQIGGYLKSFGSGVASGLGNAAIAPSTEAAFLGGGDVMATQEEKTKAEHELEKRYLHQPQGKGEERAATLGQFTGGALLDPMTYASGPGRAIATTVIPAIASQAAGEATEGSKYEQAARALGGIGGGLLTGLGPRAVTPIRDVNPRYQAKVDTLEAAGVPMTAGQRTASPTIKQMEDMGLTVGGVGHRNAAMGEALTQAATAPTGTPVPDVGHESMQAIDQANRTEIQTLTGNTHLPINPTSPEMRRLAGAVTNYEINKAQPEPALRNQVMAIARQADDNGGFLTGSQYQSARADWSRWSHGAADARESQAWGQMRDALDDAMEQNLAGTPYADRFGQYRQRYQAQLAIEAAAKRKDEFDHLTPGSLESASMSTYGARKTLQGGTDIAQLGDAAKRVLQPLKSSGTTERLTAIDRAKSMALMAMALGTGGGYVGHPEAALAAIPLELTKAFGPAAVSRATMSRPMQAWLGNRRMAGVSGAPIALQATINALMGQGGGP